jgi:hypothetical protein
MTSILRFIKGGCEAALNQGENGANKKTGLQAGEVPKYQVVDRCKIVSGEVVSENLKPALEAVFKNTTDTSLQDLAPFIKVANESYTELCSNYGFVKGPGKFHQLSKSNLTKLRRSAQGIDENNTTMKANTAFRNAVLGLKAELQPIYQKDLLEILTPIIEALTLQRKSISENLVQYQSDLTNDVTHLRNQLVKRQTPENKLLNDLLNKVSAATSYIGNLGQKTTRPDQKQLKKDLDLLHKYISKNFNITQTDEIYVSKTLELAMKVTQGLVFCSPILSRVMLLPVIMILMSSYFLTSNTSLVDKKLEEAINKLRAYFPQIPEYQNLKKQVLEIKEANKQDFNKIDPDNKFILKLLFNFYAGFGTLTNNLINGGKFIIACIPFLDQTIYYTGKVTKFFIKHVPYLDKAISNIETMSTRNKIRVIVHPLYAVNVVLRRYFNTNLLSFITSILGFTYDIGIFNIIWEIIQCILDATFPMILELSMKFFMNDPAPQPVPEVAAQQQQPAAEQAQPQPQPQPQQQQEVV